ncbi:YcxB family protein [Enhydrobacter aerosaccus]|nr:YcxB family protein [Enhydrobacter aerosaccus]
MWLTAIVVPSIGLAVGWRDDPVWISFVEIAVIMLVPLCLLIVWRAHFTNTVGKFRSMTRPVGEFVFGDQDVTIRSELGSMTLPWARFTDVWQTPEFWMIFLGQDQFVTLPVMDIPEETLAFLRSRLPHNS